MAKAYYANQYFTTTLSVVGGINDSITTSIVLQSVSGIEDTSKPGIALFNYADPLNESIAEWITFDSINSTTKTLVGVTRGAEKGSAKSHSNGVTIAFPMSESHINPLVDAVSIGGDATNVITGVLDEDTFSSNSAVKVPTQQSVADYFGHSVSTASTTTPAPTGDRKLNEYYLTALAGNPTFAAPSGTPVNGNKLIIRIEDDGTSRTLAWNAIYEAKGVALPTATTISKMLYIGFIYNSTDSKWDCIASSEEA